jgi:hypothetical protein
MKLANFGEIVGVNLIWVGGNGAEEGGLWSFLLE